MNRANALTFLVIGVSMWLLPVVSPDSFRHVAVDGSSTRALWLQVMGLVQLGLGATYLLKHYPLVSRRAPEAATVSMPVPAAELPELPLVLDIAALATTTAARQLGAEVPGSITLHGRHADLWRAFNEAIQTDGHAREFARRLSRAMQETDGIAAAISAAGATTTTEEESATEKVVAFAWDDAADEAAGERGLVSQDVA
jgi:hypothetical protein